MLKQILAGITIGAIGIGAGFAGGAVYKDKTIDVTQKDEYKQVVNDKNDLNTKLDATKLALANLTTQRDSLEATKKQLEGQLATAQKQLNDKTAELESKHAELESADERIKVLNAQIATLETDAEANATQITALQGQVTTLTDTKTSLEADIADLNEQIQALNANIEDNTSEIENLTTALNAKTAELETANSDIETLNAQISTLETKSQNDAQTISTLRANVEQLTASKQTLENQISELNTQINNLNAQISEQQTKISELSNQVLDTNKRLNAIFSTDDDGIDLVNEGYFGITKIDDNNYIIKRNVGQYASTTSIYNVPNNKFIKLFDTKGSNEYAKVLWQDETYAYCQITSNSSRKLVKLNLNTGELITLMDSFYFSTDGNVAESENVIYSCQFTYDWSDNGKKKLQINKVDKTTFKISTFLTVPEENITIFNAYKNDEYMKIIKESGNDVYVFMKIDTGSSDNVIYKINFEANSLELVYGEVGGISYYNEENLLIIQDGTIKILNLDSFETTDVVDGQTLGFDEKVPLTTIQHWFDNKFVVYGGLGNTSREYCKIVLLDIVTKENSDITTYGFPSNVKPVSKIEILKTEFKDVLLFVFGNSIKASFYEYNESTNSLNEITIIGSIQYNLNINIDKICVIANKYIVCMFNDISKLSQLRDNYQVRYNCVVYNSETNSICQSLSSVHELILDEVGTTLTGIGGSPLNTSGDEAYYQYVFENGSFKLNKMGLRF